MTVFEIDTTRLNYADIVKAIKDQQVKYTVEFYPEEGKYHYTGHRKCQVCQSPQQTQKLGTTCPVCGRPLTVGVMHRVEQLANQPIDDVQTRKGRTGISWTFKKGRPSYVKMVPLVEIIAEVLNIGVSSKSVVNEYEKLTNNFGSEWAVLMQTKPEELIRLAGEKMAEGITKVRQGNITVKPGYDGVFGTVKIWGEKSVFEPKSEQASLF